MFLWPKHVTWPSPTVVGQGGMLSPQWKAGVGGVNSYWTIILFTTGRDQVNLLAEPQPRWSMHKRKSLVVVTRYEACFWPLDTGYCHYHLINFKLPYTFFFFFNVTWSRVNVQGADTWLAKFREKNCLAFSTPVLGRVPSLLTSLMQWQDSLDLGRGFRCWAAKSNNKTLPRSIVIQWKDKT